MAKKLISLLCLMLAVVMAVSMTSCSPKKPTKKPIPSTPSTEAPVDSSDDAASDLLGGEELLDPDEFIDTIPGDSTIDIGAEDIIGGEEFEEDEFIMIPEVEYSTNSPEYDNGLDGDDFGDLGDLEDNLGPDRLTATSLIQKEGEHVDGKEREFNIDVNNVAYPDFRGLGSNVFPCSLTDEAFVVLKSAENWDYDDVNFQIEADRWNTIKSHYNRMWFDIHWFTTSVEENYKRQDIENNKDYQNYLNGVYDYESDYMKSMYKYLQVWQDSGSITALNYCWKVGERIQEWYNFPNISNPNISAPYDLDAYARSCADLLVYLREEKGFTSIECLTFYNEPHYDGDFDTFFYEPAYWVAMVKRVEEELIKRGIRDDIEIWANEHGSIQGNPEEFAEYIRDNAPDTIDMWAFHSYYSSNTQMKENNYSYWYHFWSYMREKYGKKIYVTETYASTPTYGSDFTQQHAWRSWTDSRGSQMICAANVGLHGVLDWGMTGGYVPKPVGFTPSDGPTAAWEIPRNDRYLDKIQHNFFDESLITNYIPAHSDVLMVDWTGDDLHGSAFKLPDGGYSILLDVAGNIDTTIGTEYEYKETSERNITFNLSGLEKDVTFYRYTYDPDDQYLNPHARINTHDKKVSTKNGVFKDTVDKDYGMYLYTTMAPVKQIEIDGDSVLYNIAVGTKNKTFTAKTIDCNDDIVWSISAATDGNRHSKMDKCGTINSKGVYTLDKDAKVGDKIAIRASLKSDPKVHDTVMIRITKKENN